MSLKSPEIIDFTKDLPALKALATEEIQTAVMITDGRGTFLYHNEKFSELLGFTTLETTGQSIRDLCHANGTSCSDIEHFLSETRLKRFYKGEMLVINKAGHPMWVGLNSTAVRDAKKNQRLITTVADITYAKLHETLQHKVLEALMQDKPLPEILTLICLEVEGLLKGVKMSVLRVSDNKMYPLACPSLPEHFSKSLEGIHIGPKVGSAGTAAFSGEPVRVNHIPTDPLWEDYRHMVEPMAFEVCWATPIKNRDSKVVGTFGFYSKQALHLSPFTQSMVDICTRLCTMAFEKCEFQERIQYLAHNDALTGLPNRAFFQSRLIEEATRACRQKTQIALHVIDLDRFKEVNDTLGHPVGDNVLRIVAKCMRDHAAPGDVLARLGGDEFVFLQVGVTLRLQAEARATHLVESIRTALSEHFDNIGPKVGASVGFALFPEDAGTVDHLVRHADMALYRAKSDGRNRWRAFTNEMAQALNYRRRLEVDLRKAIEDQALGLFLVYQPQLDLRKNRIIGYEALVRWNHPEFGFIPPSEFIPIAEDTGLIVELGHWIISEACSTAAKWTGDLYLAVNLSPLQIFEGDLTHFVHEQLVRTGLRPTRLELEVTEGVLIENTDRALHVLRRLKGLGLRIAMDDFGTGYSSLSYLQTFPFDRIKIDRSFVSGLGENTGPRANLTRKAHRSRIHAEAIIRAVIGLGHALGIPIVAEGVETEAQRDLLSEMGCDILQGYLIGRPLPDILPDVLTDHVPEVSARVRKRSK
jgi:diguanylate cyclase (GGDEF)-like protein/PAS domain S-box-containing protein